MYFNPADIPTYDELVKNGVFKHIQKTYGKEFANKFKGNLAERSAAYEIMKTNMKEQADGGMYKTIFHELGHLEHEKQSKKIFEAFKFSSFGKNQAEIDIARKVSDYAAESPVEFVAEVFSDLLNGKKYSKDIMDLYNKYGGPKISGVI